MQGSAASLALPLIEHKEGGGDTWVVPGHWLLLGD